MAHLGCFRTAFVEKKACLSDRAFADLVALFQFLPGPASSQVGLAIGLMRGGWLDALAAFTAFTLPSAITLILFAYGARTLTDHLSLGVDRGAQAFGGGCGEGWGQSFAPTNPASPSRSPRLGLWTGPSGQVAVIVEGGIAAPGSRSHLAKIRTRKPT